MCRARGGPQVDGADQTRRRSPSRSAGRSSSRSPAAATTAAACWTRRRRGQPAPTLRGGPPPGAGRMARGGTGRLHTELAAQVARSPHGQAVAYPVVRDRADRRHLHGGRRAGAGTCRTRTRREAQRIALQIADSLGVVGMLAVELFDTRDGRLLVNELAMRPHNSGHWSIDGARRPRSSSSTCGPCSTCRSAPPRRARRTPSWSTCSAATHPDLYRPYLHCLARDPGLHIHMYGKEVRPGPQGRPRHASSAADLGRPARAGAARRRLPARGAID